MNFKVQQITVEAARLFDGKRVRCIEHFGLAEDQTTLTAMIEFTDGSLGCISICPEEPIVARIIEQEVSAR